MPWDLLLASINPTLFVMFKTYAISISPKHVWKNRHEVKNSITTQYSTSFIPVVLLVHLWIIQGITRRSVYLAWKIDISQRNVSFSENFSHLLNGWFIRFLPALFLPNSFNADAKKLSEQINMFNIPSSAKRLTITINACFHLSNKRKILKMKAHLLQSSKKYQ